MSHKKRNIAVGGAVIAGVSYLAGILTAPKSGRETRKDINKAAHKAMTEAERHLKVAHSELNELIDKVEIKIKKGQTMVGAEFRDAIKVAKVVKTKTSVLISAIHEGEAADKDLDEAVKEAKQAIKHLKSFVIK